MFETLNQKVIYSNSEDDYDFEDEEYYSEEEYKSEPDVEFVAYNPSVHKPKGNLIFPSFKERNYRNFNSQKTFPKQQPVKNINLNSFSTQQKPFLKSLCKKSENSTQKPLISLSNLISGPLQNSKSSFLLKPTNTPLFISKTLQKPTECACFLFNSKKSIKNIQTFSLTCVGGFNFKTPSPDDIALQSKNKPKVLSVFKFNEAVEKVMAGVNGLQLNKKSSSAESKQSLNISKQSSVSSKAKKINVIQEISKTHREQSLNIVVVGIIIVKKGMQILENQHLLGIYYYYLERLIKGRLKNTKNQQKRSGKSLLLMLG